MKSTLYLITVLCLSTSGFAQIPVFTPPQPSLEAGIPMITTPTQSPYLHPQQQPLAPLYNNNISVDRRQIEMYEQDMLEYNERRRREKELADLVAREFSSPKDLISYRLATRDHPSKELFYRAYNEFVAMLNGQLPLDIKTAVFLAEHPFDPSFNWEQYNKQIKEISNHIYYKLKADGISVNDNVAKNLALFEFFTDTVTVKHPGKEAPVTTYPMFYDFEDFWGRKDPTKVFVSKLLRTGTGQCHSLPLLYLILAEQLNVDAYLAFSANHSYIKFMDNFGIWQNIELTNHVFTSNNYIIQSGFINATALKSKIYLQPLTKKEVIAQCVNDLASGYMKKYGYDDFVLKCTNLALKYLPNSTKAHQLQEMYYGSLNHHVITQYKKYGLTRSDFEGDEKAMRIYGQLVQAQQKVDSLGWMKMPDGAYTSWLNSLNEEANKQEHRNRLRTIAGQIGK